MWIEAEMVSKVEVKGARRRVGDGIESKHGKCLWNGHKEMWEASMVGGGLPGTRLAASHPLPAPFPPGGYLSSPGG